MTYKDKLEHMALCYGVTVVFGFQAGVTVGLTIEFVQGEAASRGLSYKARIIKVFSHFKKLDTWLDLLGDYTGIILGLTTRKLIGWDG